MDHCPHVLLELDQCINFLHTPRAPILKIAFIHDTSPTAPGPDGFGCHDHIRHTIDDEKVYFFFLLLVVDGS